MQIIRYVYIIRLSYLFTIGGLLFRSALYLGTFTEYKQLTFDLFRFMVSLYRNSILALALLFNFQFLYEIMHLGT